MARRHVRYLVEKQNIYDPAPRYYWQPSAALKAAGWPTERLATPDGRPCRTLGEAVAAAELRNAALDAWRLGLAEPALGGRIAPLAPPPAPRTVDALIAAYKRDPSFARLAPKTRAIYTNNLAQIARWAGDKPVAAISAKACKTFYRALHDRAPSQANAVLRNLRILFKFAMSENWRTDNPATTFQLWGVDARHQIWTAAQADAMVAVCDAHGRASIGTALLMASYLAQREGDVLAMTWSQYRDGRFRFRQAKTGKWVDVPAAAPLRARIEALRAAAEPPPRDGNVATLPAGPIVVAEPTGAAWKESHFQHEFARLRAIAAARDAAIAELQFRDLRRTGIVRLGELDLEDRQIAAVSGHEIETTKRILEVYLPRSSKMAADAIERLDAHLAGQQEGEG